MSLRKYIDIVEQVGASLVLYHGTCEASANALVNNGWVPNSGTTGSNMGQSRFLYLTTGREDALWFAEQKGCYSIVEVRDIPMSFLRVDPEDGMADSVHEEINNLYGLPGKLVLTRALGAEHFRLLGC